MEGGGILFAAPPQKIFLLATTGHTYAAMEAPGKCFCNTNGNEGSPKTEAANKDPPGWLLGVGPAPFLH